MKKIMVVAAYKLNRNGEGDSLPYDSYVVAEHVVDGNRNDADRVGVRRNSYFWKPLRPSERDESRCCALRARS